MGMHAYTYIPYDSICVEKEQISTPRWVKDELLARKPGASIHGLFRRTKYAQDAAVGLSERLDSTRYSVKRMSRYVIVTKLRD
jgi:hypothetical protein